MGVGSLIQKVEKKSLNIKQAVKRLTPEELRSPLNPFFQHAVLEYVRSIVKEDPDVRYYEEDHPVFTSKDKGIDLLFEHEGKTIYGQVSFIDLRQPTEPSPLKYFHRNLLYIQRTLRKLVHYWAIVNRDFAETIPDEISRFEANGYTLVRMNVTLRELKQFYEKAKQTQKKIVGKKRGGRSGRFNRKGRHR
ncbi:MAG: hypothetical protein KAT43_00065 [Nanoarchaeota archaeon]|nr:hypothetical protein [Nanoarchaeota archaeon]